MVHGRIQKRNWIFRNSEWCDLCKEPVAVWANHHGRKDHALMDQHYSALVEYPRRWNPEEVLRRVVEEIQVPSLESYQEVFRTYDRDHHNELFAMLVALKDGGMLSFGEPRNTFLHRMQGGLRGMDHQGALVLHEYLLGPLLRLYPEGHIQDFSNLVDFITCAYNMETVYDLCLLQELDEVAQRSNMKASSPAAMGLGGASASSPAATGFHQPVQGHGSSAGGEGGASGSSPDTSAASAASELASGEAFSRKAVFVRQILGQLRWLTLPGEEPVHPAGYTFPPHLITLGEICLKTLVVEIISSRVCEYMVRAEPVWRSFGYERRKLEVAKEAAKSPPQDVLPRPVVYSYRPTASQVEDCYCVKDTAAFKELHPEDASPASGKQ